MRVPPTFTRSIKCLRFSCVSRSIHGSHLVIGSGHCRYRMFEPNMDEYLDEEIDSLKQTFEHTYRDWEKKVSFVPPHDSYSVS